MGGGLRTGAGLRLWGPDFPIHGAFQTDGSGYMDELPLERSLKCFLADLEAAMDRQITVHSAEQFTKDAHVPFISFGPHSSSGG